MSSPTGRKVKSTASVNLEKNQKTLERLKKKLELRLKERDSMTERFKLLIKQEQSKSKRQINATERVTNDYKYLTNRINSIRAEILSLTPIREDNSDFLSFFIVDTKFFDLDKKGGTEKSTSFSEKE